MGSLFHLSRDACLKVSQLCFVIYFRTPYTSTVALKFNKVIHLNSNIKKEKAISIIYS
ncbi:hypothetical protein SHA04_01200 [Staphylococcus haemolyticus]|nr:hypothetical protein SHA04_01200 [Staphylococcus haemolyticus]